MLSSRLPSHFMTYDHCILIDAIAKSTLYVLSALAQASTPPWIQIGTSRPSSCYSYLIVCMNSNSKIIAYAHSHMNTAASVYKRTRIYAYVPYDIDHAIANVSSYACAYHTTNSNVTNVES